MALVESRLAELKRSVSVLPAAADATALRATLDERARLLGRMFESAPKQALRQVLPAPVRAQIAARHPELAPLVETRGQWSGAVTVLAADDFRRHSSRRMIWMEAGGEHLSLSFVVREPPALRTGAVLKVRGIRLGKRVAVLMARPLPSVSEQPVCDSVGEQKVVALMVNFPGRAAPRVTVDQVREALFGSEVSLKGYWESASYGQTTVAGDVFGPFMLDRAYSCSDEELTMLRDAALQAAATTVDLAAYNRVLIYYPEPAGGCDYTAVGTVGCSSAAAKLTSSYAWMPVSGEWARDLQAEVAMHEGGHNLGLEHAASAGYGADAVGAFGSAPELDDYGDPFSTMGGYDTMGHYSAQDKRYLGWLASSDVLTVTDNGDYRITPLSSAPGTTPKALRVRRTDGQYGYFWIEYRRPTDVYETSINPDRNKGALIHYDDWDLSYDGIGTYLVDFTPGSRAGALEDFWDAPLPVGTPWADPWTPRTLSVTAADADGLSITVGESACVTLSSQSISLGPESSTNTVSVTAPAECTWPVVSSADWITVTSPAQNNSGNGSVSYTVSAQTGPDARAGGIAIGHRFFSIEQSGKNEPPYLYSADPEGGTGPGAEFFFYFDDPNGWSDIQTMRMSFNTAAAPEGGCAIEYDAEDDRVRLYGGGAQAGWSNWVASDTLPDTPLVSSACSLIDAYAYLGAIYVDVLFAPGFHPQSTIYASAVDQGGLDSGWQEAGAWTLAANQPPQVVSVSPSSGYGLSQLFDFTFRDPNGASDIYTMKIRFVDAATLNVCSLILTPYGLRFDRKEFGCAVDMTQSFALAEGLDVQARLAMSFPASAAGLKNIRMSVIDFSGAEVPFEKKGEWVVGSAEGVPPSIAVDGVTNTASLMGGPVAQGEMVTISGINLGPAPAQPGISFYDLFGLLGNQAGDTRVFFDDVQAPMVWCDSNHATTIVPYSVIGHTRIRIENQGRASNEITVPVALSAPGIFCNAGTNRVLAVDEDKNLLSAAQAVERGKKVTFFITGEGQTTPGGYEGWRPPFGEEPMPRGDVRVSFGGVDGMLWWTGQVYAGVTQIDVTVPETAPVGSDISLVVTVGAIASPPVVLAIR